MIRAIFFWGLLLVGAQAAVGQQRSEPQALSLPPAIDSPQDIAYPGIMTLEVDATDLEHRVFLIRQTIPISGPGTMVLLYPRWIPGTHAAIGPIYNFAGLKISANGQSLRWTRDPVDVYAYRIEAPAGAKDLQIEAQLLTPTDELQGGIAMTREMLRLNWYALALYPSGYYARRIEIDASVTLPEGWQFGTALDVKTASGNRITFKTVSFDTLADSPLLAGKYFKKIDLYPQNESRSRVTLNLAADEPELLEVKPTVLAIHRELVNQADKLYAARHFDHYDFLLSLSERLGSAGIEHQRSSDNGTLPKYFTGWDIAFISRDLLPHEYVHSWNGKYRRPADLWTPNFNVPMRNSLLWVYEGQTQYWGYVLATRAGFLTKEQALENLATTAAAFDTRVGRTWRNLQDTTNDPLIANRRAIPWTSWQRSEDYYVEGQLIWLEVDTLIRERSKNKRSLDDFARAFFGVNDGDWGQLTYTFDDVVSALDRIEPYDWAAFFRTRLDETGERAPLGGLRRGGYRLLYAETQSDFAKAQELRRKLTDLTYSLGIVADPKGLIESVLWSGPAYVAGLTSGMTIIAVNGVAYEPDRLKSAIKGAAGVSGDATIELLIRHGEVYRTIRIDYRGGLRYPKLERIKDQPALLDDILAKKK